MDNNNKMEKIVSLAKRRGFVFLGSEIYGGLAGTWDYGPLGAELLHNIKEAWWNKFVNGYDDIYGLASSIIMPEAVWRASGHLEGFVDPLVECLKCKKRYKADQFDEKKCPDCGGDFGEEKPFNTMFPVEMGSTEKGSNTAYLRGELAQGMFVNFKNIVDSFHPKLPFGIAQIGKCFRNEISPRDFLFRVREFDLMEFEYFIREENWEEVFEFWRKEMWNWIEEVGLNKDKVHELEVAKEDLAHYSKRTIDFEYDFPFGRKELYGLAYRTDHDLKNHKLDYYDEEKKETFTPHVVEPTFGAGRTVLAVLCEAYSEDEMGGEKRVFLKLKPQIAPVKVAIFPLLKNKPELMEKAKEIYGEIKKEIPSAVFDSSGNIGKRYRRQDEIGTPFCITVDFDTLEKDSVTVRDRDTGEQERVDVKTISEYLKNRLK
ncbi:MAG: glycine--tRNA ligase [Candidatus Marinimicrobia bacterium]|nr:glycine--tRNA ligase [Candidatus Neomarinimicrobiota bacterium]